MFSLKCFQTPNLFSPIKLNTCLIQQILKEYKIHNADITLNDDATSDDLIDVIEGNRVYVPAVYVLNKIDQISIEELDVIYKIPHCVPISAHHKVAHHRCPSYGARAHNLKNFLKEIQLSDILFE